MPAEPRLLVITPDYPPRVGGIQLLVSRLVEHLNGFEICLVAPPEAGDPRLAKTVTDVPKRAWRALSHRGEVVMVNGCAVVEAMRFRPDLVLNMHVATSPSSMVIRRVLGVPFVQYAYAKEIAARPLLARASLSRACRAIAISRYCRQLLLEHGANPDTIRLITPGEDAPTGDAHRQSSAPRVVSIGRLQDSYKGHDTLIRAMPLVRAQVPDARCRIIGDGPLLTPLKALARTVGGEACIDFLGAVSDEVRDQELADATVFCMPSRLPARGAGEGFGIVYLEAAMHGVPSVAAGVGGSVDAVLDGETGFLTKHPTDHVELANVLLKILRDPALAARLGRQARAHAKNATWERMSGQVADVCRELTNSTSR